MILDASALLALLQKEPGADRVQSVIHECSMSTVNWSEVVQKLQRYDPEAANIRSDLEDVGLKIVPFSVEQAELCADLWKPCSGFGVSLADRVCIQLGLLSGELVLTADKDWKKLEIPKLKIELIR